MDAYNLAVVIGPSLFPTEEKIAPGAQQRLIKTCELFKVLIENANNIGILPENILERIASSNCSSSLSEDDSTSKKKKKRRSGSLTRMFNGIKRMVGSKNTTEDTVANVVTPDIILTPSIRKSVKKRRVEISSMSARKKRDVMNSLPDGPLRTPIIPSGTPVSVNPDPRKKSPLTTCKPIREKKKQWYTRGKGNKGSKSDLPAATTTQSTKSLLERRLSAVSRSSAFQKIKKRTSCDAQLLVKPSEEPAEEITDQAMAVEPDYVKISRSEYEEIKNRVSEIERRISVELQCAGIEEDSSDKSIDHTIDNVQYVYQKTLVEAKPLSPSTDHIARRLSKELKIRRSCEQKVHRSPSARKIGSLRRRSREREKQNVELKRNQTWHIRSNESVVPKNSPKTPVRLSTAAINVKTPPAFTPEKKFARPASFHGCTPMSSSENWETVPELFPHSGASENSSRTPLDKLRSQNAGLVMEKAKFFDGLSELRERRKVCVNRRIGTQRNQSTRLLRMDEKINTKKSLSPQKRKSKSPNTKLRQKIECDDTEKENMAVNVDFVSCNKLAFTGLKECNRIETLSTSNVNVRNTPTIKRTLCARSPRQLCRTPRIETTRGCTPLKIKPIFNDCS